MRRLLLVLSIAALMAAMVVASAMPAFADKGGVPHDPSCGAGRLLLSVAIPDPTRPGASEISLPENRPQASGCPPPQQSA
jgi:hypothetical protein